MNLWIPAILLGIAVFFVQSLLFRKSSRRILHLIPVFIIVCVYLLALALFLWDLHQLSGVRMNSLYALLLTCVNTVALIADGWAWLIEKV